MNLKIQTPEDAIRKNKELNSFSPKEDYIKIFKKELKTLFDKIEIINGRNDDETEEHLKTDLRDFLIHSVYARDEYAINTKGKIDLAIYLGKDTNTNVGVIIEAKRPKNKGEMISVADVNKKALHEILLYSFKEREINPDLKYIIITNVEDWYLININDFENKHIFNNTNLKKEFNKIKDEGKTNPHYYEQVKKFIPLIDYHLPCVHFNLNDYKDIKDTPKDQKKLINLYKLLSPDFLLKKPLANDSNKLNTKFYNELLHIIGIEPVNEGGKIVIKRKAKPDAGSFLENTINILETEDVLRKVAKTTIYGITNEDKLFNIGLELVLTWINRVLFLKLLEGQLKSYNKDNPEEQKFLNPNKIKDFDELYKLFHQVLARNYDNRSESIKKEYGLVPYLNSSLFEISELESLSIKINSLDDNLTIPVFNKTVIKSDNNILNPLKYLLEFLNAYDFGSEKDESIASEKLINASVLGLIFEKINGYKDGSFYTPGFITQYMCKETIERAVIKKFNEVKGWDCKNLTDLHNKEIDKNLKESNAIIDSVKICDPAVGSGHFLVSALNQMIAIKHELKVLVEDRTVDSWKKLTEVDIKIINDELSIQVNETNFLYNPKSPQSQTIQKALFEEKQIIIENCLFGVDINPNSVKICRLRLWIELLKNAYYKEITLASSEKIKVLETLPNIDINIKCGNSLISRFGLDTDLKEALQKSKLKIEDYKRAVDQYRNADNKEQKHEMEILITEIKSSFNSNIDNPFKDKIKKARWEVNKYETEINTKKQWGEKIEKILLKELEIAKKKFKKLEQEQDDIKSNKIYENAFEWRFEFPEVLNNEGDFVGFDVVIGNPPYIRQEEFSDLKPYLKNRYEVFNSLADLLTYFVELSHTILKEEGVFQFIISGKFTRAGYGTHMRRFLAEKSDLTHYIDFSGKSVFDEATVDAAIVGFIKKKPIKEGKFIFREVQKEDHVSIDFNEYIKTNSIQFPTKSLTEDIWSFDNPKWFSIIEKVNENGIPLSEWDITINFGIKTGFNEAFIIDETKRNELIASDPKSVEIIKPILRGRDIQKYIPDNIVNWVIGTFPSLKLDIDNFPATKEYLMFFGEKIHQTGEVGSRKKTSHKWFETQDNIAFWKDFEKPKLIWKRIGSILRFCYDESGAYCLDSTCIATGSKVKFLTAVLNSKLCNKELFRLSPKTGTGDLIISVQALNHLRIPMPNTEQEVEICNQLNKILSLKKDNPAADTSDLEIEIDFMVYALYGLTKEEIEIIEGS